MLWENNQEREKKKEKIHGNKGKERERNGDKSLQKRANELKVQLEKTEKGEVPILKWKDLTFESK